MIEKRPLFIILFILFFQSTFTFGQVDSIKNTTNFGRKLILPASLILTGSLISGSTMEHNLTKSVIHDKPFHIDDYLVFAPIAELYIADLAGVEAQNHWFDQSKYLFMANVVNLAITNALKYPINKHRPSGDGLSFPSGHTSSAFTNATVLYEEFKETSPILAYSGFAFATTTGTYRILNNRHWLSDVVAGAGIGILSAELIYHFKPLEHWNPFLRKRGISFVPVVSFDGYGLVGFVLF